MLSSFLAMKEMVDSTVYHMGILGEEVLCVVNSRLFCWR